MLETQNGMRKLKIEYIEILNFRNLASDGLQLKKESWTDEETHELELPSHVTSSVVRNGYETTTS